MINVTALLLQEWFVQEDDLIGGWTITNIDKAPSQLDHTKGEYTVGTFLAQAIAENIVHQHNKGLHLV